MDTTKPTVALVDDHLLLRKGLASIIQNFGNHEILFEANNGKQCMEYLAAGKIPSIILLDINMPVMDGYDTALNVKNKFPDVKVLALSMDDSENAVLRMLRNGARGYIVKDIDPIELNSALNAVIEKGFYYSEMITGRLFHMVNKVETPEFTLKHTNQLNNLERAFIKLACSELTYKEIADRMNVTTRAVEHYRKDLFEKLSVKSRVGLVLFAIANGMKD